MAAVTAALVLAVPSAALQRPTTLSSPSGRSLGKIVPYSKTEWFYGASEECHVEYWEGEYDVTLTHNDIGSATRAGKGRWIVWTGQRFRGYIHERSPTVATITKRGGGGRVVAIARGPDPVAAGAVYLALGVCG